MKKKAYFLLLLASVSSATIFAFEYWYMDANVRGNMQTVYFFRDLRTMDEAMGMPPTIPGGPDFHDWYISGSLGRVDDHTRVIFARMRSEGFTAAFVYLWYDSTGFVYQLFLRSGGREYCDLQSFDVPIRF